jgi:hypothetical protein
LPAQLSRTGKWFLRSGIQEPHGGVARYYRSDQKRNAPVSTEITGYTVCAFVYLHSVTHEEPERLLAAAIQGARFLSRIAWDSTASAMPFEIDPAAHTYFFDCGIIVRGLLSAWRATGEEEFLATAIAAGNSMLRDFAGPGGDFHPILALPAKTAEPRDDRRWSRTASCYQLKAAMAWWDLWEATEESCFREPYYRVLEYSLAGYRNFLPGHPERDKVMDRLHAFCYFLEGLLPCASDPRCAAALADGISMVAHHLHDISPEFARSDVYAQLLRARLYADWLSAAPLDCAAAAQEAEALARFQAADPDPRIDGGYWFGHKQGVWLPFVNPVSAAFATQALDLWRNREHTRPHRHLLI